VKVIGPDFISLQVSDIEVSAVFYSEQLGLQRAAQSPPGAVLFATTPIPFAVRNPAVDLQAVERLGWGVALWLKSDDPQALHDRLVDAGVQIVTAPFDGPFGRTFVFADPDGYAITIHS
jgi:predicted enzyme related to lactoylglutathione lyase